MKTMKLTSIMVMLTLAFGAMAQEEFYDDVYFSSGKTKKKEKTSRQNTSSAYASSDSRTTARQRSITEMDVDAYNRRYNERADEAYDDMTDDTIQVQERRSDNEYSERIVRYHSPSKITIAGADNVELNLSDGYYSYGYDTDYSDGESNVNIHVNIGNGWDSWYSWYDPWSYYSPYSWRWRRPYWGWSFGWGWGGFYAGWYDPWYDPWYGGYYGGCWSCYHYPYYPYYTDSYYSWGEPSYGHSPTQRKSVV